MNSKMPECPRESTSSYFTSTSLGRVGVSPAAFIHLSKTREELGTANLANFANLGKNQEGGVF